MSMLEEYLKEIVFRVEELAGEHGWTPDDEAADAVDYIRSLLEDQKCEGDASGQPHK